MRTVSFIFAATLALAAFAHAESVSEDEDIFNEATSFVQTFIAENQGGETACMKVATDSITTIKTQCAGMQANVDKAAKANLIGKPDSCCKEGNGAVCSAAMDAYKADQEGQSCQRELKELLVSPVSFAATSFKDLTQGKCGNFYTGAGYKKLKKAVEANKKACNKISGAKKAAKGALSSAVESAARNRGKCNDRAEANVAKMYKTAHDTCNSATNQKAYKRAMHMKCVLSGTALKDCAVNGAPKVTHTKLAKLKCAPNTGLFYDEPATATTVPASTTEVKCQFLMKNSKRADKDGGNKNYKTHNYEPWNSCLSATGNGKEKIRGFRLTTYQKNLGLLYYEKQGVNTNTMYWNNKEYYLCPRGWHWATKKEWFGTCKSGSGYNTYGRCGGSNYWNWNSYGSYQIHRTYWRFSDSRANHANSDYYVNSANSECSGGSTSSSSSGFGGILCAKD